MRIWFKTYECYDKREIERGREGERERGGMHHEKLAKEKPFLIVGNLLWAQIPEAKNSENEKYWNKITIFEFLHFCHIWFHHFILSL